jgi:hypothetical protein
VHADASVSLTGRHRAGAWRQYVREASIGDPFGKEVTGAEQTMFKNASRKPLSILLTHSELTVLKGKNSTQSW